MTENAKPVQAAQTAAKGEDKVQPGAAVKAPAAAAAPAQAQAQAKPQPQQKAAAPDAATAAKEAAAKLKDQFTAAAPAAAAVKEQPKAAAPAAAARIPAQPKAVIPAAAAVKVQPRAAIPAAAAVKPQPAPTAAAGQQRGAQAGQASAAVQTRAVASVPDQGQGAAQVQAVPGAAGSAAEGSAVLVSVAAENAVNPAAEKQSLGTRLKNWFAGLSKGQRRFGGVVFIPTVLTFIYFGFIASPMYISEVKFALKTPESGSTTLGVMSNLFKMPTSSLQDAMVVEEYLRSNDAFNSTSEKLGLIEHYSDSSHDLISRLQAEPTVDDISKFWRRVSTVSVNQDSSVVTFKVRAYTAEMAHAINVEILRLSEMLVNSMNERAKDDMLKLADIEVNTAKERLYKAQSELRDFRNLNQDLDLKATAEGMQSLVIELETEAARLRTQIAEQSRYTDENAVGLQALKARLSGIEQQIERERERLTQVPHDGSSINILASQYENLVAEAEFARQQLVMAMTSYEQAKADLLSKNLYIVTVAKPSMPDEALYPEPFLFTFYVFIALTMIYAVTSLIAAAIREHMGY